MKRLKNSASYNDKKDVLITMGTVLLNKGYNPAFVAGALANIYSEGNVGKFESSKYTKHPEDKPEYMKIMDEKYNYNTKYSGQVVTKCSLSELKKLLVSLGSSNYENGKFGLGCAQWTGARTKTLVDLYIKYANGNDRITLEQATEAEAEMIANELAGEEFKSVYEDWKKKHSKNSNTSEAAYNAGRDFCNRYEKPKNKETKAIERAGIAKEIYKIMMGNK